MKFSQKEKEIMFESEFEILFGIFEKELTDSEQTEVIDIEMYEGRR